MIEVTDGHPRGINLRPYGRGRSGGHVCRLDTDAVGWESVGRIGPALLKRRLIRRQVRLVRQLFRQPGLGVEEVCAEGEARMRGGRGRKNGKSQI